MARTNNDSNQNFVMNVFENLSYIHYFSVECLVGCLKKILGRKFLFVNFSISSFNLMTLSD